MIAIIGGSGLTELDGLKITDTKDVDTPYGRPSAAAIIGEIYGKEVVFLPRHGVNHAIPPHKINYRANIWALKSLGIREIVAVAAVGSITGLSDCGIMIPDQILDYTYGREHTFFNGDDDVVKHTDFTYPYCNDLRKKLVSASSNINTEIRTKGTYGATQGPRFETIAEIDRMERDGADIVGMTGMPEAVLAMELGLCYATIAMVVNPAAGRSEKVISLEEINVNLEKGISHVKQILKELVTATQ